LGNENGVTNATNENGSVPKLFDAFELNLIDRHRLEDYSSYPDRLLSDLLVGGMVKVKDTTGSW